MVWTKIRCILLLLYTLELRSQGFGSLDLREHKLLVLHKLQRATWDVAAARHCNPGIRLHKLCFVGASRSQTAHGLWLLCDKELFMMKALCHIEAS